MEQLVGNREADETSILPFLQVPTKIEMKATLWRDGKVVEMMHVSTYLSESEHAPLGDDYNPDVHDYYEFRSEV